MDVGVTESGRGHPLHFITGAIVLLFTYCSGVLAVKELFLQ